MYEVKSRFIQKHHHDFEQDSLRLEPYFLEANYRALADYYQLEILEIKLLSEGRVDRAGLFFLGNIDEKKILFSGGRFGYLGFSGSSSTCLQNYYPSLLELAYELKLNSITLADRGHPGITENTCHKWVCTEVNYLVATVKDNVDNDGLYFPNSKRKRDITRNLKKAHDCGLTCRTTKSIEELSIWYESCHLSRMRELNTREWDYSLLKTLVNNGSASLVLVEDMHNFIRGGCLIVESNTDIELFMMSSNSEWQSHGANYLMAEYIYKMAYEKSKNFVNWQASNPPNGSVADFKRRWGAVNTPFYQHSYLLDASITPIILRTKAPDFFVYPYKNL